MKTYFHLIILIILSVFTSCKKDAKLNPKNHPIIITNEITEINSSGVTLNAKLIDEGQSEVIDFGFIIKSKNTEYIFNIKNETSLNNFTKRVEMLEENTEYSCIAFIKTEKLTIYANKVLFNSKGANMPIFPKIENYSPSRGTDKTSIIIRGRYFNLFSGEKSIMVHGTEAEVIKWEDNLIEFITPEIPFFGETRITINFGDVTINLNYEVLGPQIKSISKMQAHSGEIITLIGENFNSTKLHVFFGDYEADILSSSNTLIELLVPAMFYNSQLLNDVYLTVSINSGLKNLTINDQFLIIKSWTKKCDIPFDNYGEYGFTYDNNGYIYDSNTNKLWEYNPTSNIWQIKSTFPGSVSYHSMYIIHEEQLFKIGGVDLGEHPVNGFWVYNFTYDTWTEKEDIPFSFKNSTYFLLNNNYYIITDKQECWMFIPESQEFIQKNDFPENLNYWELLFSYLEYGSANIVTNTSTWQYNLNDDSWQLISTNNFIDDGYRYISGFSYNNTSYVNYNSNGMTLYKYNSENNKWFIVSHIPLGTPYYISTFVLNNKVYFIEGNNHSADPSKLYVYEE